MNPRIRLAAILIASALAVIVGYNYLFSTKAAIKRAITKAERAFESCDLQAFIEVVSKSYHDENGLGYDDIRRGASDAFAEFTAFKVTLEKLEIVDDGESARCSFLATVVASTRDRDKYLVLGTPESGQRMDLDLRRESGKWRVIRARGISR